VVLLRKVKRIKNIFAKCRVGNFKSGILFAEYDKHIVVKMMVFQEDSIP
jgi:hypothetical protein